MSTVGQIEKRTQERVVSLFRDTLGYEYLGDWTNREDNRNVETNLVRDFLSSRQFQVALVDNLVDGDPDPYPIWHLSQIVAPGQNFTGFDNKDVSNWLDVARTTTDRVKRFEYYRKFQELFSEELPALPLYYPTYKYAISSRVKRVQVPSMMYPSDRLRTIGNWYINVKRVLASEATAQSKP